MVSNNNGAGEFLFNQMNNEMSDLTNSMDSNNLLCKDLDNVLKKMLQLLKDYNIYTKDLANTLKENIKEQKEAIKQGKKTGTGYSKSQFDRELVKAIEDAVNASLAGKSGSFNFNQNSTNATIKGMQQSFDSTQKAILGLTQAQQQITQNLKQLGSTLNQALGGKGTPGAGQGKQQNGLASSTSWIFNKNNTVGSITKGIANGVSTLIGFFSGRGFFRNLTRSMFDAFKEANLVKNGIKDLIRLGFLLFANWVREKVFTFLSKFLPKEKAAQYADYAGGAAFLTAGTIASYALLRGRGKAASGIMSKLLGKGGAKTVTPRIQTMTRSQAFQTLEHGDTYRDAATGEFKKIKKGQGFLTDEIVKGSKSARGIDRLTPFLDNGSVKTAGKIASKTGANIAGNVATSTGLKIAAKSAGKGILKKVLPGVGLAYGLKGAYDRGKEGDWVGSGLELASGGVSLVPGWGTAAAIGIETGLGVRDYQKAKKAQTSQIPQTYNTSSDNYEPSDGISKLIKLGNSLVKLNTSIKKTVQDINTKMDNPSRGGSLVERIINNILPKKDDKNKTPNETPPVGDKSNLFLGAPVPSGGHFGDPRGGGKRVHKGADRNVKYGSGIFSQIDGTITRIDRSKSDPNGYGNYIEVTDKEGKKAHLRAHMATITEGLQVGQKVKKGTKLGTAGYSGNADKGKYAVDHYEIYDTKTGERIDPITYFKKLDAKGGIPTPPTKPKIDVEASFEAKKGPVKQIKDNFKDMGQSYKDTFKEIKQNGIIQSSNDNLSAVTGNNSLRESLIRVMNMSATV